MGLCGTEYLQFRYLKWPLILGKHHEFRTCIYVFVSSMPNPAWVFILLKLLISMANIMGPFGCGAYHQVAIGNMIINQS
jgi:hypothetical protein